MNPSKTAAAKLLAMKYRSPYPRAAKHGKHSELQGFPNTRGLDKQSPRKKSH